MEQNYRKQLNIQEDKLFLNTESENSQTHINLRIGGESEKVYVIEWDDDKYKLAELGPGRLVIRRNEVKE